MIELETLEPIKPGFPTGCKPVLVTCVDFNDYVCKYPRGVPTFALLAEYLGYQYAKLWQLNVPDAVFIKVLKEHFIAHGSSLQPRYFQNTCFGSLYDKNSILFDQLSSQVLSESPYSAKKVKNWESLLYVSLFDIWIANEDRNFNNSNLLLNASTPNQSNIVVIDHNACFKSCIFDSDGWKNSTLTENESLIYSDIFKLYVKKEAVSKDSINEIIEKFYFYVEECRINTKEILNAIPKDWEIDIKDIHDFLKSTIFDKTWLVKCCSTYKEYLNNFLM